MGTDTSLTPFLIDPSDIALKWLENLLMKNKTVDSVLSYNQRLYTSLELAIRFGKALIIRDVVTVDPILVPILRRNYLFQGTRKLLPVGDKLVDYNSGFQLYLIGRNANVDMQSYFTTLFTSVNFEITYPRLSQQLLRCALSVEKPELEDRRVQLLKKEEELKMKLFTLQDNILIELANAQGNVLENKELLVTLNETKKHSTEIKSSLIESEKIQTELTKEYEMYKPLAEKAAGLYFCTLSLKSINNFYQISMEAFIRIYQNIFSPADEEIDFNIDRKLHRLIQLVYNYICRFLFKEDLLTFALHLIHNMHPDLFQHNEWELFNREILVDAQVNSPEVTKAVPAWANKEQAFDIFLLKHALPSLYDRLDLANEKLWQKFMRSSTYSLEIGITEFQMVLVTQAFKPGYLYSALTSFVQNVLGLRNLAASTSQLDRLLSDTNAKEPVLIIISPGVDPSEELRSLAKAHVGSNFHEIALGRGQTEPAITALQESAKNGGWLILKNLHLMTSWLPKLEKEFRSLNTVDDNFRLWLTSESHPNFPSTLIQICLKITNETPQGVKRNLERTYCKLANESFSSIEYARSIFVLSWFHAIVQERRTYIPQGWCKFYEFNDSDLFTALKVIQKRFMSDNKNVIKWNYVHGLFEQAIYGGRIDNFQDLQVLMSYLRTYFNHDVINTGRKTLAPDVYIPESSQLKEYCSMIQRLPEPNSPKFFSLPLNVDLSWQKKRSSDIIAWLKILKRHNIVTSKSNYEEWKSKISPVLHLWKQLNQEVGILKMKTVTSEQHEEEPIRKFIAQELNFAISLANHIHRTLVEINKMIRSPSPGHNNAISLIMDIANQRTPDDWLSLWEGSFNLVTYIRSVMNRASSVMKLRKDNNTTEDFISKPVDLKKFFNPQTFLSIFKQFSSRLNGVSLDNLQLECSWKNYIRGSRVALIVESLLLEGAYIDANGALHENSADSSVLSRVPDLQIAWVSNDLGDNDRETVLQIPVYHNAVREDVLMMVKIPIAFHEHDKWIQMNPAFYLQE